MPAETDGLVTFEGAIILLVLTTITQRRKNRAETPSLYFHVFYFYFFENGLILSNGTVSVLDKFVYGKRSNGLELISSTFFWTDVIL